MIALCPECGRKITVRTNKFGDEIYARHKMATAMESTPGDETNDLAQMSEVRLDFLPGHNPFAHPIYEIDCPMSGQPL